MQGKRALIVRIGDDMGFGFAIAHALAEANATIIAGVWPPIYSLFKRSLELGKFDQSRMLSNGQKLNFERIYPVDVAYDTEDQVPKDVRENKRYKQLEGYTISQMADYIKQELESIDILVHAVANSAEIQNPLLETSRQGYLQAIGVSTYSMISLLHSLGPIMKPKSAALSLTYLASTRVIPGYGGGMSSAKAALESDTKTLAFEAGRKWGIRVNTISAGPYKSRAARAIGKIDDMIAYSQTRSPLTNPLYGKDVGHAAAFLLSDLASAITGHCLFVDNGFHIMGM